MQNQSNNRLEKLRQKREQIENAIKDAERQESQKRRKLDAQRKIIVGSIFMREISNGNRAVESIFIESLKKSSEKSHAAFPEYFS